MLDEIDEQREWINDLTNIYHGFFGAGGLSSVVNLDYLFSVVEDLASAHEVLADLYRDLKTAIADMLEERGGPS